MHKKYAEKIELKEKLRSYLFVRCILTVKHALDDITVFVRWFMLWIFSKVLRLAFFDQQICDKTLIKLGNAFFPFGFSVEMYQDYESYVKKCPPDVYPYINLVSFDEWLYDQCVLDLGSGLGQYSDLLLRLGARQVISLEYQTTKANWAGMRYRSWGNRMQMLVGSALKLPFRDNSFQAVFSHTVFEHLQSTSQAIGEINRILAPGGRFLISYNYLWQRGGHHLFPFVRFPWPLGLIHEEALCEWWSDQLARHQKLGFMRFYPDGCRICSLSEGNEIHLNRVSFDMFEQEIISLGLEIEARYASELWGRIVPSLLQIPWLRDALTGSVFYCIRKPDSVQK